MFRHQSTKFPKSGTFLKSENVSEIGKCSRNWKMFPKSERSHGSVPDFRNVPDVILEISRTDIKMYKKLWCSHNIYSCSESIGNKNVVQHLFPINRVSARWLIQLDVKMYEEKPMMHWQATAINHQRLKLNWRKIGVQGCDAWSNGDRLMYGCKAIAFRCQLYQYSLGISMKLKGLFCKHQQIQWVFSRFSFDKARNKLIHAAEVKSLACLKTWFQWSP
jgi:hypothetical protein